MNLNRGKCTLNQMQQKEKHGKETWRIKWKVLTYVLTVLKGYHRDIGEEVNFEDILARNFPELMKDNNS